MLYLNKYKGGKQKQIPNFEEHYSLYASRKISKSALAKTLGISRPTLNRIINEYIDKDAKNVYN